MKKLAEYTGEDALDIVMSIVSKITPFVKDEEVMQTWKTESVSAGFSKAREKHPDEFMEFISCYSGKSANEIKEMNMGQIMELYAAMLTDSILLSFFASPSQKKAKKLSGSATATSKAKA